MEKLDELAVVIPPPTKPNVALTDDDWLEVFAHIGTRLPQDYVQFYKRYGEGYFYSISHRMSANISIYAGRYEGPIGRSFSFRKCAPERLTELRLRKERRPKSVPFPLYWEPGGLLPWGSATNDTDLCWKVRGELVDNWTVVALRATNGQHESFDVAMTVFLKGVVDGSIHCSLLPKGFPGEKGVGWEVCRFGTQ
jgi:hypothetical protein